jgi:hypothetical protein
MIINSGIKLIGLNHEIINRDLEFNVFLIFRRPFPTPLTRPHAYGKVLVIPISLFDGVAKTWSSNCPGM